MLTSITDRNGNHTDLSYGPSGNLETITDSFGRAVTLTYSSGLLQTISAGGRTVTYSYEGSGPYLEQVDWSDASCAPNCPRRTYTYGGSFDGGDSTNLTFVEDSNGNLIEEHRYDDRDRVILTQSQGGNYKYVLNFDSETRTTVTDARNHETAYTYDEHTGLVTEIAGPGCPSCGGAETKTMSFHPSTKLERVTDGRGVATYFDYDAMGNMTTKIEAEGVPGFERVTTYTYDSTYNFPKIITVPSVGSCATSKVVTNSYDPLNGDLVGQDISGCSGGNPVLQSTTYWYDPHGQVQVVDGPREVADLNAYDYYSDSHEDLNLRGRLRASANALGHQTDYAGYDMFGNAGSITDSNDVETTYLYNIHNKVIEQRIKGDTAAEDIVTAYDYDSEGNSLSVRLPNCVAQGASCEYSLEYGYDAVNRLEEIRDPYGNKIFYTFDLAGNRTREEYLDDADVVQRFTNFKYDDYNRLQYTYFTGTEPEAAGSVFYKYTYYGDGSRETETDPEGHTVTFDYDELKRLKTVSQLVGSSTLTTRYGHDSQDNLESVIDPRTLETIYTNSDLGWRLTIVSPDSGTTTYEHDEAGNVIGTVDARGSESSRSYDELNRLVTVSYPNSSLDVTNHYDSASASFGVGRLTGRSDASGSGAYSYDRRGLLVREDKTISGTTFVTQYVYDKTGNLEHLLYPTPDPTLHQGEANYTYDDANRISGITALLQRGQVDLATNFSYKPFGPRTALRFGNELEDSRTFGASSEHGLRYQVDSWSVGSLLSFAHAFDNDLQLIGRTDNSDPPNNRTFRYDEVHRLTGADGPWGPGNTCDGDTYTYDANGNRLCKGEGAAVNYFYVTGTNRLDYSSGGESVSYDYDENGNTIEDGAHTFEYSDANRLFAVYGGSTASYAYDADGRRVIKRFQGATTYFFYDPQGRLLTEFSPGTKVGKDYIYLEGAPVGRIDWEEGLIIPPPLDGPGETEGGTPGGMWHSSLYFYHADQLGTPIAMTDANGGLVWQAEYLPFGDLWELPLSVVSNNLRFPGQYLDSETGLHQNGFRDYSSPLGRYVEADPIGLAGGLNLYAYAAGSPTRKTDRRGLDNVGCDTFDESVQTPCRLECCAIHDECYDRNKCSCESWKAGRTPCDRSAACAACNNTVAVCWLVCADRLKDDPSRPNYYCAMQHRYVRIPGDFDTLDQARKACEHDHSSDCRLRELLPLPPTPRPGNPI